MTKHLPLVISLCFAVVLVFGSVYLKQEEARAGGAGRTTTPLIYGDTKAPVRIVMYSDFECPFCKQLFPVFKKLVDEHPERISWEYRHLPLKKHLRAEDAAYAAECVFDLRGNDAFWSFTEVLYSGGDISGEYLRTLAAKQGIETKTLDECVERDDIKERIARDRDHAVMLGAQGTPFSIIVYEDGSQRVLSGALPEAAWRKLLLE